MKTTGPRRRRGSAMLVAVMLLAIAAIVVPAMVQWLRMDARGTASSHNTLVALNLARGGLDRAVWRLKSSSVTWNSAAGGVAPPGYNFDVTYPDIEGGRYRIRVTSGPAADELTIVVEGRDTQAQHTRAVRAVYRRGLAGGLISSTPLTLTAAGPEVHWGPIVGENEILLGDVATAGRLFPRKIAKQSVVCNIPGFARDTNGPRPPNTDNVEWWSMAQVAALPELDLTAHLNAAQGSGTLNVSNCTSGNPRCAGVSGYGFDSSLHAQSTAGRVWYWDNSVTFVGDTGANGIGVEGTIIVQGDLTIGAGAGGALAYSAMIPAGAAREYAKIDGTAADEYPGDTGLATHAAAFTFGTDGWSGVAASDTRVAIHGFVYVNGNLVLRSPVNVHGVLWVSGQIQNTSGSSWRVFFDDTLATPLSTNVPCWQREWAEIPPSLEPWN